MEIRQERGLELRACALWRPSVHQAGHALRAKLLEVAFAAGPKLALTGSVIGARLDEATGHGRANLRFRRLIVDWMRDHRADIAGLEPAVPLILQVHRLTDDQLRALVRSADDLAGPRR